MAERSAVNRQVLGSIPSGGVIFFFLVIFNGGRLVTVYHVCEDRSLPCSLWSGVQDFGLSSTTRLVFRLERVG